MTDEVSTTIDKNVIHIKGPREVECHANDVVVIGLIRNIGTRVYDFCNYYVNLGVRHLWLIDNASIDRINLELLTWPNITLLSSNLPFKIYKNMLRKYLLYKYGMKCWTLCVDIDEYFDYPYSDEISLPVFIKYLELYEYTVLVTQMIDMYSDFLCNDNCQFSRDNYLNYETQSIRKEIYNDSTNNLSNLEVQMFYGGVRDRLFKVPNLCLTKHALVNANKGVRRTDNSHNILNARIADITAVLYHYKLCSDLYELCTTAINEDQYHRSSYEYRQYWKILSEQNELNLKSEFTKRLSHNNDLVSDGTLIVTSNYQDWVKKTKFKELG